MTGLKEISDSGESSSPREKNTPLRNKKEFARWKIFCSCLKCAPIFGWKIKKFQVKRRLLSSQKKSEHRQAFSRFPFSAKRMWTKSVWRMASPIEPWKKRRRPHQEAVEEKIRTIGELTTPTFRKRKYVSPSSPQVIAKRAETEEGHGLPSFVWSV